MNYTIPMSGIATYNRCPRKFRFEYLEGWRDDKPEKAALAEGTSFHLYMEMAAKEIMWLEILETEELDWDTPMGVVAAEYIKRRGLPMQIISADDEQFVQIFPNCRLRTTFDLVYIDGDMLIIRDWKTFERAPSLDIDLDFQARCYLWAATQIWPDFKIYKFEHVYIRRTCPDVPKDKAGKCWTEDECYMQQSMILTKEMMDEDGREIYQTIGDILSQDASSRIWKRVHLKGGGYDQCSSCSVKELCKAEKQGNLNEESDYLSLAVKRDTVYDGI